MLASRQSQRKVNEAAEVILCSMILIAVFEERAETRASEGSELWLPPCKAPVNDRPTARVQH